MSEGYERRIGDRVDMAAIPVEWRITPPGEKRGWRRKGPESGLLLDLSVSGMQVRAPASDDLSRGSVVHLSLGGVAGWGKVRRIRPVPKTRFADYGLELPRESFDLVAWVHAQVAASPRAADADWGPR